MYSAFIVVLFICSCFSVYAETEGNYGKPKALDVFVNDIPYTASIGTNVTSEEKKVVPNEFKVIVDDEKIPDMESPWFPVEPTATPTPVATEVIPVDITKVGAQICVLDETTEVIVDFAFSSAGYKNEFRLDKPRNVNLGWSQGEGETRQGSPFGTTWSLGTFPAGTELIFADKANGVTYYTGPADRNPDNLEHAAITLKNPDGTNHKYLVTFEDFWGGGDKDYNDLEFYVSGNLSIDNCPPGGSSGDEDEGESGGVIPFYVEGTVCKCKSPDYNDGKKVTCVAQFTYTSTGDSIEIPVKTLGGPAYPPWNEFTGSGMVEQYRCQPSTFYIDVRNAPFWTNRFWNNIQWKLGYEHSVLVKCEKSTPWCEDLGYDSDEICTDCKNNHDSR